MREIKFRGKRKDNGEWVEGGFIRNISDKYLIIDPEKIFIVNNSSFAKVQTPLFSEFAYEVIPETVGQYTGLKDKNGKEIYEGDVVKIGYYGKAVVRYGEKYLGHDEREYIFGLVIGFYLEWVGGSLRIFTHADDLKNCEVIGNIHDNPELLEGVKK